ncbi:MAG: hypothetical protein AB8G05_13150 [Oligoflexales bacterium]
MDDGHAFIKFYLTLITTLIVYFLSIVLISLGMNRFESMPRPENLLTPFKPNKFQTHRIKDNSVSSAHECHLVTDLIDITAHELKWSEEYLRKLPPAGIEQISEISRESKTNSEVRPAKTVEIWHDLNLTNMETLQESIDYGFAQKLALASKEFASYRNSRGLCLMGVRIALNTVLKDYMEGMLPTRNLHLLPHDLEMTNVPTRRSLGSPGRSAETFKRWAIKNPVTMCVTLGLGELSKRGDKDTPLMRGSILAYGRGRCGFHRKFGHIEIVVNEETKEVCSDHCRVFAPYCQPDLVLIPVRSCDWLMSYQGVQDQLMRMHHGMVNFGEQSYHVKSWHDHS